MHVANLDLQFGRKWRFAVWLQMAICSPVANGDLQFGCKYRFAVWLQMSICSVVANLNLQCRGANVDMRKSQFARVSCLAGSCLLRRGNQAEAEAEVEAALRVGGRVEEL